MMKSLKFCCFLLVFLTISTSSHATKESSISVSNKFNRFLNATIQWRNRHKLRATAGLPGSELELTPPIILAGALSFLAASISSAGGIGGGGLFLPILTIVAGLDLKTASSFSAFMVTGGSIANVACNMVTRIGGKTQVDYDIALLSEPFMLLGVSIGVICNVVLPEWLITIMFAVFLAWSTFKTFKSGVCYWKLESEWMSRNGCRKMENGAAEKGGEAEEALREIEEPLLHKKGGLRVDVPWVKLGWLIVIWLCFFVLYLFRGDRYGQGIIAIKTCGVGYWTISATQIPLGIIFTSCILYGRKTCQEDAQELEKCTENQGPHQFAFPVMALLAGGLGGVFGIGGGMLISPLLLQVGITPEITAATCSFMVFFSSTMSAFQYLLLGMDHVNSAIMFALICFAASLVGLKVVQRAVVKHGRASLIVFSVGIVMAVSSVLITSFGAIDVWRDYTGGKYMGFKLPC